MSKQKQKTTIDRYRMRFSTEESVVRPARKRQAARGAFRTVKSGTGFLMTQSGWMGPVAFFLFIHARV